MMKKKKTAVVVLAALLVLFAAVNVSWLMWRNAKYSDYNEGMEKQEFYSSIVPRYIKTDEEGFIFGVKYPGYLSVTGNLSVTMPSDNGKLSNGLIIWPNFNKTYEYGVIIEEGDSEYLFYIDENGNAIDDEFKELAVAHQADIDMLLDKADLFWNLES